MSSWAPSPIFDYLPVFPVWQRAKPPVFPTLGILSELSATPPFGRIFLFVRLGLDAILRICKPLIMKHFNRTSIEFGKSDGTVTCRLLLQFGIGFVRFLYSTAYINKAPSYPGRRRETLQNPPYPPPESFKLVIRNRLICNILYNSIKRLALLARNWLLIRRDRISGLVTM
jgi:hypothetical protein